MTASGFNLGKFFDGPYPLDFLTCASRDSKQPSLYGTASQSGVISVFHGGLDKALEIWEKQVRKGHIKKVHDLSLNAATLEIMGSNLSSVFITTPIGIFQSLGIRLPNIVLVVKNLRRYFMFDVMVLDDKNFRRRFRFTNAIQTCRVKPHLSVIPLVLEEGWNEVIINLPDILAKNYPKSAYKETVRVQVYGNCRLRRVLFCERVSPDPSENSLPADVKAFIQAATQEQPSTSTS